HRIKRTPGKVSSGKHAYKLNYSLAIISAISIIVSIIGTFACLTLFGFTINLLTLICATLK
ncbi:MAG: hypothetical protein M3Z92_10700, partial [Bacteroidota bacterium]|nr:hypothetical protein [Bacteroidota bacterium]